MKRYSFSATQNRWDGKKVYKSVTYPIIPTHPNDILITASETDYLDTLANKYYKDPTLWWVIASANNIGKGRMSIEPGKQLRIPFDVLSILNDFKQLNK
jgi:hypothetical protein